MINVYCFIDHITWLAVATGTVPYLQQKTTAVRYRIRGFIHYRYGTVSLTSSKQQYGTVSRFQSAIGTIPWVTSSCLVNLTDPCCLTDAERHVCHFSPKQQVVTLPFLSVIYLSLRDKHAALRWSHKFHPHLCTNWCIQIFILSTYTSRLEHSVCWSPSQVLVVCKWVSWSGRPSHDTPAVKGNAHCWIFAEELKIQPKMH